MARESRARDAGDQAEYVGGHCGVTVVEMGRVKRRMARVAGEYVLMWFGGSRRVCGRTLWCGDEVHMDARVQATLKRSRSKVRVLRHGRREVSYLA